jgi:(S)-mandelate dehydrogenase
VGTIRLVPRYFGDVGKVEQSVALMGQTYASPFGIGPTGLVGLFRPGGDLMLARAAAAARIPFVLSSHANASIEEAVAVAGEYAWFQLYGARNRDISADMTKRARDAGIKTLMVTVDTPVSSKRERNVRNGFSRPLRMRLPILIEALRHPGWIARYLGSGGTPLFSNWAPYAPAGANNDEVADFSTTQTPNRQTWKDIEATRRLWPHKLVVKGVMHPDDAVRAVECGADGVLVSNHGGRVFDRAPSTFDVFPYIRDALGGRTTLMLDSGIRRGGDIAAALALGADFTFVGRATLYGACVGGEAGAKRAIDILQREIDIVLGQMGCASPADLDESFLFSSLADAAPPPPLAPRIARTN